MTTEEAKNIRIADYLHSLGYSPVKQQGANLWYKSPFREEAEASFKVNTEHNQWFDFGIGKGGNIIALAEHLYSTDSVPYILKRIEEQTPHVRPVSFSFRRQPSIEPSFQQLEIVPLSSPALLAYLQERGINTVLAKRECREAISPTMASDISLLLFQICREVMRYATDISRVASHRKKYPTLNSWESRGKLAMPSRGSWTIFLSSPYVWRVILPIRILTDRTI